jgi:hypothetical protein
VAKVLVTELAWAAGFYDGEGCTRAGETINHSGRRYRNLVIQISQKEPLLLYRFRDVAGCGKVYQRKSGYWVFALAQYDNCIELLDKLWPYLGAIKREQASVAVEHVAKKVA